jgi:hypothetical protein
MALKGGIIGVTNTPTATVAKGIWTLTEQSIAKANSIWPLNFATETLIDSYVSTSTATNTIYSGSVIKVGQTFSCDVNAMINKAMFKLLKGGSPTGNIWAELYAITGTFGSTAIPTGSALATSDTILAQDLTTSLVEKTFNFTYGTQLQSGTNYAIVVCFEGGSSVNYVRSQRVADTTGDAGNRVSLTGSTWSSSGTSDCPYVVYGLTA